MDANNIFIRHKLSSAWPGYRALFCCLILHVGKSRMAIMLHHVLRLRYISSYISLLNLTHWTDNRRGRDLSWSAIRVSLLRSCLDRSYRVAIHPYVMDVLHVCLEVRFLLELFSAEVAFVLAWRLALPVHADHVPAQAALALKLFEADIAVETCSLMFSLYVHVSAPGGSKLLTAPLTRVRLAPVVDGVDMPSDVGRSGECLATYIAFVVGVLMLGL